MRVKRSRLLLHPGWLEATYDPPLKINRFRCAVESAEPEHPWRARHRKKAKAAERETKWWHRNLGAQQAGDRVCARLVGLADEHERHVHLLGPNPLGRGRPKRSLEALLLLRDSGPRAFAQIDGNKEPHPIAP